MAKKEITLRDLKTRSDWAEVFGEGSGGNTTGNVDRAPVGSRVSTAPVYRKDVKKIIAAVDGENEVAEWVGLFELKDGRFLVAAGGCDNTGWDCKASNSLVVFLSLKNAIQFGLSDSMRLRLEIE